MKAESIEKALTSVTKKYTAMRKKEERADRRFYNRSDYIYSTRVTIKEVAWDVMEQAYLQASSGGKLPAHARQIMYAARGPILERADKNSFDDQYFTQVLLPDYIEEFGCNWDVVYDARGHLREPHTDTEIGIGTIAVRNYIGIAGAHEVGDFEFEENSLEFPTKGANHRYGAILFVEKEGFFPLFEETKLAERFDVAIMSNKGMSVTAGRELMSRMQVPVYVLHDFDKAGFSIVGTLKRGTRRFPSGCENVVDLGLRLEDVQEWGLAAEPVYYNHDPTGNLLKNGATEAEIEFLQSQRVELNAFASDDLITWIDAKLTEHGVKKLVPDQDTIELAYRRAAEAHYMNEKMKDFAQEASDHAGEVEIPESLAEDVAKRLEESPQLPWDRAIANIVTDHEEDGE